MNLKNLFLLLGTALLWSCSSEEVLKQPSQQGLEFTASLDSYAGTRAIDSKWSVGDQIGVYAIKAGTSISDALLEVENINKRYTTESGDGVFTQPVNPIELDGVTEKDIIAYYPFTEEATNIRKIDVSSQANQEAIDVLYSNNIKAIKEEARPNLIFKHKLSKFLIRIEKGEGVNSFDDLQIGNLVGLTAEGEINLENGEVNLVSEKLPITNIPVETEGGLKIARAYILPNQNLKDAQLELSLEGETFYWRGIDVELKSGFQYIFKVKLQKDSSGKLVLLTPESVIEPWTPGHEDEDITELTPEEILGDVSVNQSVFTFESASTIEVAQVLAHKDLVWTVTVDSDWLTIDPIEGKGNGELVFEVTENTTSESRTSIISIASQTNVATITVTQAGVVQEPESDEVELFVETFGIADGISAKKEKIAVFSGYDNKEAVYSDATNEVTMRNFLGYNCVFFPMGKNGTLSITGLDIKNIKEGHLSLVFGASNIPKGGSFDLVDLELRINGELVPLLGNFSREEINDKLVPTISANFADTEITSIEFINKSALALRVTDIKIISKKN